MRSLKAFSLMAVFLGASVMGVQCAASPSGPSSKNPCGLSPTDWCPSPPGDPCVSHKDEKSCRADSKCKGMPYRGESEERCLEDGKGFWKNCPAVGCISAGSASTLSKNPCGLSPSDWCPSPPGDPCGIHKDQKSCREDPQCKGMPYRGESVVACMDDGKGFWSNCPAVGCVSR